MKTNYSLLFYLKKPKHYTNGHVPIYLRLTVAGKRAETSAGREIDPIRWNSKACRGNGNKEEIKTLNTYLDTLVAKVQQAHQVLISAGKPITAESLRNTLSGKAEKQRLLMEVFAEHNAKIKALLGKGFEPNTLKGYNTSVKHLTAYLNKQYKASDIGITELDHAFVTGFEFYLRTEAGCSDVSAAKYIKHLRKIVNLCLANGWLKQSPFVHYKSKAKAKEREYLTQQELDSMSGKKLTIERLAQVRDIFVFCCYTGLAYADVKKLKRTEIATGVDNSQWIFTQRKKTDTASRIPLLPAAQQILNKYKDHPQCENAGLLLPVLSNQKMNAYLKEIADLCCIHKVLTFHLARHTFATTVTLSNGVPIESVSKMLGHTNLKTTQHYAKILDIKVSDDMARLKEKYAAISS